MLLQYPLSGGARRALRRLGAATLALALSTTGALTLAPAAHADVAHPEPVSNVRQDVLTDRALNITWDAPANAHEGDWYGGLGYLVELRNPAVDEDYLGSVWVEGDEPRLAVFDGLERRTSYQASVQAFFGQYLSSSPITATLVSGPAERTPAQVVDLEVDFDPTGESTLTWTVDDDGGHALTDAAVTVDGAPVTATLTGATATLLGNRSHTVTVVLENALGWGQVATFTYTSGPGRGGAPTNLTATSSSTSTIAWNAPVNNGGAAITGYRVEILDSEDELVSSETVDEGTSLTVSPAVGVDYTAVVTAVNEHGTGAPASTSFSIFDAANAVGDLTAHDDATRDATVSWTAPVETPATGATLGYTVSVDDEEYELGASATSFALLDRGVEDGTYTVSVVAHGPGGDSEARSVEITLATPGRYATTFGALTLSPAVPVVKRSFTVTGRLANERPAGRVVTLWTRPAGSTGAWTYRTKATTSTDGTYVMTTKVSKHSQVQVRHAQTRTTVDATRTIVVKPAPRITFAAKLSSTKAGGSKLRHKLVASVYASGTKTGQTATVQYWTGKKWKSLGAAKLRTGRSRITTIVFKAPTKLGKKITFRAVHRATASLSAATGKPKTVKVKVKK